MIQGGQVGRVYRIPARNQHGDPVDADGNVVRADAKGMYLGLIKGVIFGNVSVMRDWTPQRKTIADTTGQIGVPIQNTIRLKFGDRVTFGNVEYKVTSQRLWEYENSRSGKKPEYYWVNIEAFVDG